MLTVTKIFKFCYGHSLPGYKGKCANIHGHNAELRVTFAAKNRTFVLDEDGMVIDFNEMKSIIEPLVRAVDHKYLNDLFVTDIPTCETLLLWFVEKIGLALTFRERDDIQLVYIRLYEGENSYAEWSIEK